MHISEPIDALTTAEYEHACRTVDAATAASIEAAKQGRDAERRREAVRARLRGDIAAADMLVLMEIVDRQGASWLVRCAQRFAQTEGA